jgi:hypothetical protein
MTRFRLIFDLRAQLYFWIATGSAFLVQTESITEVSDWTWIQWARTGIGSLISGATALRAYVDQSLTKNAP